MPTYKFIILIVDLDPAGFFKCYFNLRVFGCGRLAADEFCITIIETNYDVVALRLGGDQLERYRLTVMVLVSIGPYLLHFQLSLLAVWDIAGIGDRDGTSLHERGRSVGSGIPVQFLLDYAVLMLGF